MTSAEKFSLRWEDFQSNVSSVFNNLRDDTTFTDVTLISEDGQQIQAHKVILSASSPFFMNIFKMNKHPNPLVYLKGFKATQLHSIIDYMYHGVSEVQQENLDDFLLLAEELHLKGLTRGTETTEEPIEETKILQGQKVSKPKTKEIPEHGPEAELKTEVHYDQEYAPNHSSTLLTTNSAAYQVYYNRGTAEDLKAVVWSMISQSGTVLTCTVCGKTKDRTLDSQANHQMASHVESLHVEGVQYDCTRCDKTFRSQNTLYNPTYKAHIHIVDNH